MSQLDDLLARSQAPGRFEQRRRFSLSRDKAVEKLREFSLRDPRQYVLELIQAAVYAGATYIAVDVDKDRILLAWVGGRRLDEGELESIFDYLFADRGQRGQRHLVQLAVGINALLQRDPRVLRLESGDGTLSGTTRMDIDKTGKGNLGTPSDPLAGTYLMAEFGGSWFRRFSTDSVVREAALIEERCRYTPVPILLNGSAPFGWKASRTIRAHSNQQHESHDSGDRRGLLAVPGSGRGRGISMVVAGVEITRAQIPELGQLPGQGGGEPRSLSGVICDDDLRKTADQSDIVRDERFAAMLHVFQPVATRLIRRASTPGYQPPPLPRVSAPPSAAPGRPSAEPLPDPIPQPGARPPLPVSSLRSVPDGTPVFRVRQEDVATLGDAIDPHVFPHLVLILRDAQAASLDATAPELATHRLTAAADVDFVRRAMERRTRERSVRLAADLGDGFSGTLELTLTLQGHPALWGDPAAGRVPVCIRREDETLVASQVDRDLPGVRTVLHLEPGAPTPTDALAETIAEHAAGVAWQLLREPARDPEDEAALLRLARGLVCTNLHSHFVEGESGAPPTLVAALPASWGDTGEQVLDLPLVPTTGGPRSIRQLAAIQGTEGVWTLSAGTDPAWIRSLEDRLGRGHLADPDTPTGLLAVVRMPHGWEWWGTRDWRSMGARGVLLLTRTVSALSIPDGWTISARPLPGALLLTPTGAPPPPDASDARDLLVEKLLQLHEADDWRNAVGAADAESARSMGRLVLLHAAREDGTLDHSPLLRPSDGSAWVTPAALRSHPEGAAAPRHGPRVAERHTVLVTFDELVALGPLAPPLRFDDAPDVWRSLTAEDTSNWLIRQPVRIPGVDGWLGLRAPFDATTGVLLQGSGALVALSALDRRLPCHGLLWLTSGRDQPTDSQVQLLRLARQELYQALGEEVLRGGDGLHAETARQYAIHFARVMAAEAGPTLQGTAATLARRVRISWADGRDFGSLAEWLVTPESDRPELPGLAAAATRVPERPRPERFQLMFLLEKRLEAALAWSSGSVRVALLTDRKETDPLVLIAHSSGRRGELHLTVNAAHPVLARSKDDDAALELVLLAAAVRLADSARGRRADIDLFELQQVLVAQRLSGGVRA